MVNTDKKRSLLIDFGICEKLLDYKECQEDIDITNNLIIYKNKITKHVFSKSTERIMDKDAIIKFMKLNIGDSYNYITNEQQFMQHYLYDMNDELKLKQIIKLFVLITICDLNLNNIRLGFPRLMMSTIVELIGFNNRSHLNVIGKEEDNITINLDYLDDKTKSLDDWLKTSIKRDQRLLFKNVFAKVLDEIKRTYMISDVAAIRIGTDPDRDKQIKETSSVFTFGKGGSKTKYKRKRNSKIKKHKTTKKNV